MAKSDSIINKNNMFGVGIENTTRIFSGESFGQSQLYTIYKRNINNKSYLRVGGAMSGNIGNNFILSFMNFFGYERQLFHIKKCKIKFFYGVDAVIYYSTSTYNNANRLRYKLGVAPFLDIEYNLSKRIVLSSETNLFYYYNYYEYDYNSQSNTTLKQWEMAPSMLLSLSLNIKL